MNTPSLRAQVLTRRTYQRPKDDEGNTFETWEETVIRVVSHQKWLWERAKGRPLDGDQEDELDELARLLYFRKISLAGRTLWLGGTEVSRKREASQFNCSFTVVESVYDVVDVLWLLLQGCGVGFSPVVGQLTGFTKPLELEVIRSSRQDKLGEQHNTETYDPDTGVWSIRVGDSAEAWAKSIGKLLAGKYPARKLVLDFSQIRPAGERLKGYGWISSGDSAIARAYTSITDILNRRAGSLLTRIDILDIVNWLGTILSSRRSAEIALLDYGSPEWEDFATAKYESDPFSPRNPQRQQSNNSLLFHTKPSVEELEYIFELMQKAGGSEPGFINAEAALKRAPWFRGVNPCAEILLGNKSFCNLVEVDLGKFRGNSSELNRALYIAARANYRQTCVSLLDGILQEAWHLNNAFLRLCGVGLTGVVRREDLSVFDLKALERVATSAAYSMADELHLPRPKNVTTIKPSGTLSKIMDTTEGMHKPLGKYIFNNVNFSRFDPIVTAARDAGYNVRPNPIDPDGFLITLPVKWDDVKFGNKGHLEVDNESAISQLERYKMLMTSWCHQNVSATIYYTPEEVPEIIQWLDKNWDNYVGVSFLYRQDPTKTAKDLGYAYLPQECVTKEVYEEYVSGLRPLDLDSCNSLEEVRDNQECAGGVCPVR